MMILVAGESEGQFCGWLTITIATSSVPSLATMVSQSVSLRSILSQKSQYNSFGERNERHTWLESWDSVLSLISASLRLRLSALLCWIERNGLSSQRNNSFLRRSRGEVMIIIARGQATKKSHKLKFDGAEQSLRSSLSGNSPYRHRHPSPRVHLLPDTQVAKEDKKF